MNRLVLVAISLLFLAAQNAFAGPFGPAEAQVKPGEFSFGVGAFHYSDDWNFKNLGNLTTDAQQNLFFVQLDIGLFPTWEIYLRGGEADVRVDGALGGSNFKDDYNPYATAGIKGLLRRGKYLDVGVFAEGSYFHEYTDSSPQITNFIVDEAKVVNAGLTFQKEIEGALLYGGPFYHYRQGDFWLVAAPGNNLGLSGTIHGTYEEDNKIGGFLGIRWTALKDIVVEGEVQLRNNLSGGGAISFVF